MDGDIAQVISDFDPQVVDQELTGVLLWASDFELAERLWLLSEQMTGVKLNE